MAASASKTPRTPKRHLSGNKKYKKEGRKTLNHELLGEVLNKLFTRNPRHNEHIIDAFILENNIVFAQEDK